MNVSDIILLIREQTFTDSIQVPDSILIKYINIAYHEIEQKMVSFINEHLFYERQTTNLIANQNAYTLPSGVSTLLSGTRSGVASQSNPKTTNDIRKILSVSMMTDTTDIFYTKCKETNQANLEKDIETYQKTQSKACPFFVIQGYTIFVYPSPTKNIPNGLKFEAIRKLVDLTLTSTESDIGIPRDYHKLLIKGTKPRVFDQRGKFEEKNRADADYAVGLQDMVRTMTDMVNMPLEKGYYNAKRFMY